MTDLRAPAQQALEALDTLYRTLTPETPLAKSLKQRCDNLRAALKSPVPEPVAVVRSVVGPGDEGVRIKWLGGFPQIGDRLYTFPQQQPAEPVQEPVAWIYQNSNTDREYLVWRKSEGGRNWRPLYLAPPQRPAEPVGYLWPTGKHPEFRFTQQERDGVSGTPVYLSPPQRKPLTNEEVNDLMDQIPREDVDAWSFRQGVCAAESAHGVKEEK